MDTYEDICWCTPGVPHSHTEIVIPGVGGMIWINGRLMWRNPEDLRVCELPLGFFNVDCDGSACGSSGGRHRHAPQDGGPPLGLIRITEGHRELIREGT